MIHFNLLHWMIYLCLLLSAAGSAVANDDYIILLDQSASMREKQPGNSKIGYDEADKAIKSSGAVRAIYDVVDLLKEGDYFSLITFGNKAELFTSQAIEYRHERDLIKRQASRMRFDDNKTDIAAALKEASVVLESLNTPQRRKILIMITDGMSDPPAGSPFATVEQQQKLYQQLKDSIRFSKWNVVLLGLGAHTNVGDIAVQLGLPLGNTLVVNDYQSSEAIRSEIASRVKQQRDARVELTDKTVIEKGLELQLRPGLLGGYSDQKTGLTLKSTFPNPVKVQLQTQQPLNITGDAGLLVKPSVLDLTLNPEQTVELPLNVSYQGDHPPQGYREGTITFRFAEGTTPFYPAAIGMRLILPGWWDVYGLWAVLAMLAALILATLIGWYIYRAQAPEVRIAVLAGNQRLGEPITLKRGESFSIANNEFIKKSVPATGLNCKTAATVKYLGRHQFEISADEAKILSDGKEYDHLAVHLDSLFDLKDRTGKTLHTVMLTKPDRAIEFLGASRDVSPF